MDAAALSLNIDSSKVVQAANDLDRFATASDRAAASASKVSFGNQSGSIAKLVASVQSIDSKMSALISTLSKVQQAEKALATANDNSAASMVKAGAAVASADSHVIAFTAHLASLVAAQRDANAHVAAFRNHIASAGPALTQADAHVLAYQKHLATLPAVTDQAAAGVKRLAVATATGAGMMAANTGNIAAQFQDIGVTAAMGMNPLIIGLQQGTQLSAVFAQSGASMGKVLAAAFMQIASAQALMTIGIVAAIAALVQMVDWSSLAQTALNSLADILPEVATAVAYLGAVLTLAFAPQILAAILTAISYIGTSLVAAIVAATQAMIAFSIANPFAAFVIAVGLAAAAIWAFNDDISKVLGFNVLATVKKAANYVIGAFVGAFHDIQFVWNNFPAIMGAAAIGATNAVIRSINWLLEKGAAGINGLINTVNSALAVLGMGPIGNVVAPKLAEFANRAADGLTKAVSARNSQLQKDLTTDYIGAFGNAIGDAAKWAQGKIRGLAGSMGADAAAKTMGGAGGDAATAADKIKPPPPEIPIVANPIMDLTLPKLDDIKPIETAMTRLYEGMKVAREVTRGFLSDWINGVREGGNIFKTFADSVVNSLNRIIDKLLDRTLDSFLDSMFAGGGGGGSTGGIFSSLFGGGKGGGASGIVSSGSQKIPGIGQIMKGGWEFNPTMNAMGGVYGTAQKFAKGGSFTNSVVNTPTLFRFAKGAQLGEMGEAGPEAIMPLKRGPNGALGVQASGGGSKKATINISQEFKMEGVMTPTDVSSMVRQGAAAAVQEVKRNLDAYLREWDVDGAVSA